MTRSEKGAALGFLAICCTMVFCAMYFASAQAIWVDETTQLSGLTLGFSELPLWLSGRMEHPFAVPPDRMPPLSYWLGKIWAGTFGLTEMSMRGFGVAMALCAAPALFLAGRLAGGVMGGLFAVAFLFTAPDFIIQTVEIRAYSLFFCLSAWASYMLIRLVTREKTGDDRGDLLVLTALLVALSYTHFYGVIASGFFFLTLLAHRLYTGRPLRMLLICGLTGAIMLAGLLPFVTASMSMTAASSSDMGGLSAVLGDVVRLVFRLFASNIYFAYPVLLVVALAAVTFLCLILLTTLWRRDRRQANRGLFFILLPLVSALVCLTAIRLKISSFAILAPHYNLWLLPLVALAFAFAFALRDTWTRKIIQTSAVCLISVQLLALTTLMTHRSLYSHGPGEAVAAAIEYPRSTLVILDATEPWGNVYFPLVYLTEQQVTQWLSYPDGRYQRIVVGGLEDIPEPLREMGTFKTILRVQTTKLDSWDLAAIVRDPAACDLPPTRLFAEAEAADTEIFCAFAAARYSVSSSQ